MKDSLALHLVNKGYDLWLGNNRGNKYSKPADFKDLMPHIFYDFSFTEMGQYDAPAFVEKILEITKNPSGKVTWIGHSEGTTQMFIGLSDKISKDYLNAHIKRFISLAPITFLTHVSNAQATNASYFKTLAHFALYQYGLYEVMTGKCSPYSKWEELKGTLCQNDIVCMDDPSSNMGLDPEVDDMGAIPLMQKHSPAGASIRQLVHYAQFIAGTWFGNPLFNKYDYGPVKNMIKYGSLQPPAWDLKNVKVPLTMLSGTKDELATKENCDELIKHFREDQDYTMTYIKNYGHGTWN